MVMHKLYGILLPFILAGIAVADDAPRIFNQNEWAWFLSVSIPLDTKDLGVIPQPYSEVNIKKDSHEIFTLTETWLLYNHCPLEKTKKNRLIVPVGQMIITEIDPDRVRAKITNLYDVLQKDARAMKSTHLQFMNTQEGFAVSGEGRIVYLRERPLAIMPYTYLIADLGMGSGFHNGDPVQFYRMDRGFQKITGAGQIVASTRGFSTIRVKEIALSYPELGDLVKK